MTEILLLVITLLLAFQCRVAVLTSRKLNEAVMLLHALLDHELLQQGEPS